ncbi:GtrA family protein [Lichenibacterium minor]|jgi:putative flippase GtrA|uniref:GtrA family protein n=1 Tax=Lichenibacterium minor TaxID=2316528 RepID=A0A4Q2U286_9HYPH|nr:GtrA family protein [Lichenibacterium minor]RYC30250.1 GtrA family protein [Lichenibacterium minor]
MTAAALGRGEGERFLRFCCVGGIGFCVDAAMLLAFVHLLGSDPIVARLPSAACGILTTFELNRRWAFRGAAIQSYGAALAVYVGVQSLGLACNMAVYTACYLLLPRPFGTPLVCLAAAAGTAMLINYAGASRVVFRAP